MERIVLPNRITKRLKGFSGKTIEDKIVYLTEHTARANLRECNERISRFESQYGRIFSEFETALERNEIANAFDYQTETDFIEWEALEQEKEHWLKMIRSLNASTKV